MEQPKFDPIKLVQWQFKYLETQADEMSANDLDWAIKLQDSFKNKGFLTKREMSILGSIYSRY